MPSSAALRWLIAVVWVAMAMPLLAADKMSVITLKHRLAEDVVGLIRPVLGRDGVVSGRGDKLLVGGSEEQLQAIAAMVAELDVPAVSLLITVVQGDGFDRSRLRAEFGFSARVGDLAVGGGVTPGIGSAAGAGGISTRGSVGQWRTQQRDGNAQRVRATSGYPAWIGTGRSEPYRVGGYDGDGHHRETLVFRDSGTGFSVLPRVVGDEVTLELGAVRSRADGANSGVITGSELGTQVSVALGDWIEVGSVGGAASRQESAGGWSVDRARTRSGGQVWLRVQEIKQ
ncbi:MAG: hypothetical protein J4A00_02635 [Gammaproteobacteria bacterium]|nr:hypothetical protein [Gammaproteobacteria bacterium]